MVKQAFVECPTCGQQITAKKLDEITATISAQKDKEYSERFSVEVQRAVETATQQVLARAKAAEEELCRLHEEEKALLGREQALALRQQEIELEIQRQVSLAQDELISQTRASVESVFKLKMDNKDRAIELLKQQIADGEQTAIDLQNYREKEASLLDRESAIAAREQTLQAEVERRANDEFARRHAPEVKRAIEVATAQTKLQIQTVEQELNKFRERETALLAREQAIKLKSQEIDLEVQRKMAESQDQLISQATQQTETKFRFKLEEKDKTITDMRTKLLEAEARADSAGAQSRGGLQEIGILQRLQNLYPTDDIQPIAKSRGGADILQKVFTHHRVEAGTILWESKNTQKWNEDWLPKLREDQRKENADVAVIVSPIMPNDCPTGGYRDGILLLRPDTVEEVAPILRQYLINLQQQKSAGRLQDEKAHRILEYLSGKEFNLLLTGIVEDINAFRELDEKEERLILRAVAQRRELRVRSYRRLARMFGTFQGIMGSLPEVPGLALLEAPEKEQVSSAAVGAAEAMQIG